MSECVQEQQENMVLMLDYSMETDWVESLPSVKLQNGCMD